jgi:hypothetical protein
MAAPIKAFRQPTTYTNRSNTVYLSDRTMAARNICVIKAGQNNSMPVFFNQLNTRFTFFTPIVNVKLLTFTRPTTMIGNVKQISTRAMYMVTNTFPAAYTAVQLRPSIGQLWPRSGALPY